MCERFVGRGENLKKHYSTLIFVLFQKERDREKERERETERKKEIVERDNERQ
jgi:hypothetical protein